MKKISVIVLSYNNLSMIFESIDSILTQDYPNIELIISDDCSHDIKNFNIESYINSKAKKNLKRLVVQTNELNIGTVKNLNGALKQCNGDYIVPIAADDCLYDDKVLSRFAKEFEVNKNILVLTSQVAQYNKNLDKFLQYTLTDNHIELLKNGSFSEIYGHLCLGSFLPAGGTAYRRELFELYGLFDESYKLVEDWPFFLRITRLGVPIGYCNSVSLKHRDGGISRSNFQNPTNKQYQRDLIQVIEQEILPNLSFAATNMEKEIRIQCSDKRLLYYLKYEYPNKSSIEKIRWLLTTKNIFPALYRGVWRRMLRK